MKILMTCVNVHQRWLQQRRRSIMTNSVYSQLLSQVILVTAQWAHDQSSQGNYNRSYPWDQQHGHPLMKTDMITEAVDYQICLQQRPTLHHIHHHFSRLTSQQLGDRMTTLNFFLSGMNNTLVDLYLSRSLF